MATCKECGKKIGFFTTTNVVDGNLICGECDGKRKIKKVGDCVVCPQCGSSNSKKTFKYPLYASFDNVKCQECGENYSGKTGKSNFTNISKEYIISWTIGIILCSILLAIFAFLLDKYPDIFDPFLR